MPRKKKLSTERPRSGIPPRPRRVRSSRRDVSLDDSSERESSYEGDYQRGGGREYGARLANGFAMLRDE